MFTEEKRTSCWVSASRCCCCCCYFLSLKFFFYFLFILACASMSPGAIHCTSHVDILFSFVVPLYMAEHTESTISISAKFLFVSMKRTPGNAIKLEDVMIKITPRGCGNFSFLFFSGSAWWHRRQFLIGHFRQMPNACSTPSPTAWMAAQLCLLLLYVPQTCGRHLP